MVANIGLELLELRRRAIKRVTVGRAPCSQPNHTRHHSWLLVLWAVKRVTVGRAFFPAKPYQASQLAVGTVGSKAGHCWMRTLLPAKPYQASQLAADTVGSKAGHCWACAFFPAKPYQASQLAAGTVDS